jgi:hypothetical protein
MKLLNDPRVVGSLVLVAAIVVAYQTFHPQWRRAPAAKGQPPAPAPTIPASVNEPASAPAPAAKTDLPVPEAGIDHNYAEARIGEWIASPRRDPFLLAVDLPARRVADSPSPVAQWKLKAIWRQTGHHLAAINQGIYGEGDVIQGYKIVRIEDDQVWFQGPTFPERLCFPLPKPPSIAKDTNSISAPAGSPKEPLRPQAPSR